VFTQENPLDSELPLLTATEPQVASDPPLFNPRQGRKTHPAFNALLRLVLYIALVWVLWTIKNVFLELLFRGSHAASSPLIIFIEELLGFAVVYGAAVILSRIEHRPVGTYGLPLSGNWVTRFGQGCLFGLCEISALIGLIALFGGYTFGSPAIHDVAILRWAVEWAVIFLTVGLFEEFAFRGYALYTLARSVSFWPAAILLALYFGFEHSHNPGESLAGEAGVALIALLFAFTLRRTGTLWLAVGWHAAFDFGETFLYSVPDSGAIFPGHLSNASLHGPTWLTGGATGPEGSIFSFAVMGALAIFFHFLYPPRPLLLPPASAPQFALDQK
jgi:membrane protease YdiL (CAAX protease family)